MSRARSVLLVLVAVLPLALASSVADDGGSDVVGGPGSLVRVRAQCQTPASGQEVCIFNPPLAVVNPGGTVRWIADPGSACHTVTFGLSPITEGANAAGFDFEGVAQGAYGTADGAAGGALPPETDPNLDGGSPTFCSTDADITWSKTFSATTDPGVYVYYCRPHFGKGMHGIVVVLPAAAA